MSQDLENLIIVGRGAAAYTAAIYAARASLSPLVVEPSMDYEYAGDPVGPTPGFPHANDVHELVTAMRRQAERFGARFSDAKKLGLKNADTHLEVQADNHKHHAHAVILAEGTKALAQECVFLPHTDNGRLKTEGTRCGARGVFACADAVHSSADKPVIIAAGWGCQACIDAERWLQARGATAPDQHSERW